jgi:hypothetical protein
MQQLSLLEPVPDPRHKLAQVWQSLDEEQRARLVAGLARLIAAAAVRTQRGCVDEREQQDNR